jgi:pimeloyl-ACP methyl ester carboxylesterase
MRPGRIDTPPKNFLRAGRSELGLGPAEDGEGAFELPALSMQDRFGKDMTDPSPTFIAVGAGADARRIAVRAEPGKAPGLVWLGGFKSDMKGTKAAALAEWARAHGRACVRFDYSGHGESGGAFTDGTIGRWLEETAAVFTAFCRGSQIVVGSSMGGWLALLLARELKRRADAGEPAAGSIAGLVLIAPAVDFTEVLMWQKFPRKVKKEIEETGAWARPSDYSEEPYLITRRLIEEGRNHLLLGGTIETNCPVRILQGVKDPDVPWNHAVELVSRLARDDVVLTLVKDGDHRLSRPEDIERLERTIEELIAEIQAGAAAPASG